jgi:hypothetical protein
MRWLLALLLVALVLPGCKKDEGPANPRPGLMSRLPGNWRPVSVQYNAEIPFLGAPLAGTSNNPSGSFAFAALPDEFTYSISFLGNISGIPFPFSLSGSGAWTATYNDRYVVLTQNGTDQFFEVMVNEANLQRWKGTLFVTLPPPISQSIPVDAEIELVRQ